MSMAEKEQPGRATGGQRVFGEHKGHSQHLCELVRLRRMDEVAELSKNPKFMCHICGRVAAKATNLCEAVEI